MSSRPPQHELHASLEAALRARKPADPVRPEGQLQRIPSPHINQARVDKRARAEEEEFELGDYDRQARRNKHKRGEAARGAFHWLSITMLVLGAAIFVVFNIVWMVHVAGPQRLRYLAPDEIALIQNIVIAVWSGNAGFLIKKYFEQATKED
jgi:hypothetical protein